MEILRNLPETAPRKLTEMIDVSAGRVISMAMSRSEHCQMTMLAFSDTESVSEECYFGDTLYVVLEGEMPLTMDGTEVVVHAGECMAVAAGKLHTIGGGKAFKLLQITLQK